MTYLLATNAWIAYLKRKDPALIQRVQQTNPQDIQLCSIVLGELYFGAFHGDPAKQAHNLTLIMYLRQHFLSVPFEDRSVEEYGRFRADLAAKGTPIGTNDLRIAALVRAHGYTLVTHNTKEFGRVCGLMLEDWQIP